MVRHRIPTAKHATFTDAAQAHAYIDREGAPIVIKADGLAAGKGVVVAMDAAEAHAAVDMMLVGNRMGSAGARDNRALWAATPARAVGGIVEPPKFQALGF